MQIEDITARFIQMIVVNGIATQIGVYVVVT